MSKRIPIEEYKEILRKNNNDIIDIKGEFKGVNTRTLVKCKKCGREWNAVPNVFINGGKCKNCTYREKTKAAQK